MALTAAKRPCRAYRRFVQAASRASALSAMIDDRSPMMEWPPAPRRRAQGSRRPGSARVRLQDLRALARHRITLRRDRLERAQRRVARERPDPLRLGEQAEPRTRPPWRSSRRGARSEACNPLRGRPARQPPRPPWRGTRPSPCRTAARRRATRRGPGTHRHLPWRASPSPRASRRRIGRHRPSDPELLGAHGAVRQGGICTFAAARSEEQDGQQGPEMSR